MRLRLNLKAQLNFYLTTFGWTQAELARRSGVPKQSISDWMGGTPPRNLLLLKKVAEILRTSVDNLLFGNGFEEIAEAGSKPTVSLIRSSEKQQPTHLKEESTKTSAVLGSDLYLAVIKADGTIVQINGSFQKALGRTPHEIVGRYSHEFIHEEDHKSYKKLLTEYRSHRKSVDGVFVRLICKDGSFRWVQWQSAISEATQLIHCIGTDMTIRFSAIFIALLAVIDGLT